MNRTESNLAHHKVAFPDIATALALLEGQALKVQELRKARIDSPAPSPVHRYTIGSPYFAASYYEMAG